jgi:hypothetical protein
MRLMPPCWTRESVVMGGVNFVNRVFLFRLQVPQCSFNTRPCGSKSFDSSLDWQVIVAFLTLPATMSNPVLLLTCTPHAMQREMGHNASALETMQGFYDNIGTHHDQPMFCKHGDIDSYIYYWKDAEKSSNTGWWCGPQVGGDIVWAFAGGVAGWPPTTGWRLLSNTFHAETSAAIALSSANTLCPYTGPDGMKCLDPRPTYAPLCVEGMCKRHCRQMGVMRGTPCLLRHDSGWQLEQEAKARKDRCNRRSGGQSARGSRDPYTTR